MDHEPDSNTHTSESTPAPKGFIGSWRRLASHRGWFLTVVSALVVLVVVGAFDVVTASPRVCASCHEIEPRFDSWAQSAHSSVRCVQCHQSPRQWYAAPLRVLDRGRLLGGDVVAHVSGGYADPVESRAPGAEPIQDEVCLQCHDPNRKATSGFRILINHAEHAERNGSCVSCHVRTAHPLETRGTPLSLMSQCFTCHGTTEKPKASAACDTCHPSGYELKPASHTPKAWNRSHAKISLEDPKQCAMCHDKEYCNDCHGIEMPHPAGWAGGEAGSAAGHAQVAQLNRAICGRCHGNRPDMCTMCHHTGYEPTKGTWAKQHFVEVRKRGAVFCLECHSPVFCATCHVG